jgi:hypothetical protein
MKLVSFQVNGRDLGTDEAFFQSEMARMVDVWDFCDWILILRYLIFYFEDRKALVWDHTAQKQLFRILFLTKEDAEKWYKEERLILQRDSKIRNALAALATEEKDLAEEKTRIGEADGLHQELKMLTDINEKDHKKMESLLAVAQELSTDRRNARRAHLLAQDSYESALREYEHLKYNLLRSQFPTTNETALYILGQLATSGVCIACGGKNSKTAERIQKDLSNNRCVVCSSPRAVEKPSTIVDFTQKQIESVKILYFEKKDFLAHRKNELDSVLSEYDKVQIEIDKLEQEMRTRKHRIIEIKNSLPIDDEEWLKRDEEISAFMSKYDKEKIIVAGWRNNLREAIKEWNQSILKYTDRIQTSFDEYAKDFLFETCTLSWSPHPSKLGQLAQEEIEYPAFALDMTGADFPEGSRRNDPNEVSESQREFIDISFRMALMETAGAGETSLLIDAPESSLDAIFVDQAALVLSNIGAPTRKNCLIITSNVVDGQLIPNLLVNFSKRERDSRIINLFELAAKNAAVREQNQKYQKILNNLIKVN